MTMVLRILALLGSLAHATDRLVGELLGFLPFRVPGVLLVAVLLGLAAWNAAAETDRAIAARPRPIELRVGALVDDPTTAWVSVSGVLSGPHLDNSIYASDRGTHFLRISNDAHDQVIEGSGERIMEPGQRQTIFPLTQGDGVTRWFYVLRDADNGRRAFVVRSARDGDEIRTRSVVATSSGVLDGLPHLTERTDAGADSPSASVSQVRDGKAWTIRGIFGADGTEVACDGGAACVDGRTWRYRVTDVADPDASAWIDSPHPPDALPVTLRGVVTTDATRMQVVLATNEMRAALDGVSHPDNLVLADNIGPIIAEASYLGTAIPGVIAVVLLLSAIIPYPIFRRDPMRRQLALPRLSMNELLAVDVDGQLPGLSGTERPSGAPARIGWLPARELARQAWHLRSTVPSVRDGQPHLALVAIEGRFVLPFEPIRDELHVEPGHVATTTGVRPGLRLSGPNIRVMLGFASRQDRDRIERELEPGTDAPAAGYIPEPTRARPPAHRPWARPATAVALAGTGVLVAGSGMLHLLTGDSAPIGAASAILASVVLAVLAIGVARRHPLADELLPSVALLGLVVAGVTIVALPGCGTWLAPNLSGCAGFDAAALAPPLAAIISFGLSLWAMPHLSSRPREA